MAMSNFGYFYCLDVYLYDNIKQDIQQIKSPSPPPKSLNLNEILILNPVRKVVVELWEYAMILLAISICCGGRGGETRNSV